jgi:hypothetical protein
LLVGTAVFFARFFISGANALAASFYPTDCRATGVSWANGVGRTGSILGSMGGGMLLAMNLSLLTIFRWFAGTDWRRIDVRFRTISGDPNHSTHGTFRRYKSDEEAVCASMLRTHKLPCDRMRRTQFSSDVY